jgi:hypothetical protein
MTTAMQLARIEDLLVDRLADEFSRRLSERIVAPQTASGFTAGRPLSTSGVSLPIGADLFSGQGLASQH